MNAPTATVPTHPIISPDADGWGDASTDDGLRKALLLLIGDGWDSPVGRAILGAVAARSAPWARLSAGRRGLPWEAVDPVDVLSVAWYTLDRHARTVAAAQRPWAYLWVSVSKTLAVAGAAEAMLSEQAPLRRATMLPFRVVRFGLDDPLLDVVTNDADRPSDSERSASVAALVALLAAKGGGVEFWADAVGRAIDVMAGSRRSYEEHFLRRDPYLRDRLGFTPAELGALGALLIGPRRGDRAAQSLLLALHRDPTTRPQAVTGAVARIALLHARAHGNHCPQRTRAA